MITLPEIEAAHAAAADRIHRTPLLSSRTLGERTGAECYLKAETLQKTGSFKVRGALNKIRGISPAAKARGLVTVSAGNHAQAVAYAAAAEGVPCTVVMPESAPRSKVAASRGYGAEVILHGTVFDAFDKALELESERGMTFVHPYDDDDLIAGQGTCGLEIVQDLPEVDVVVVCVGGGGLISGVATAVKSVRPEARVIGVEPTGASALHSALEAGRVVELDEIDTIADGLSAPATGERVLEYAREFVDDVVLVSDREIREAMGFLLERAKLLAEPAGAAATAALLAGRIDIPDGARVAATVSGGNVDLSRLKEFLPE